MLHGAVSSRYPELHKDALTFWKVLDGLRLVSRAKDLTRRSKQPIPGTSQNSLNFWEMYLDEIAVQGPAAPMHHRRLASPPQPAAAAPARPLGGRGRKRLRLLLRAGGEQACSLAAALAARAVRVPVAGLRRLPLRSPCALPPARARRRDAGTRGARALPRAPVLRGRSRRTAMSRIRSVRVWRPALAPWPSVHRRRPLHTTFLICPFLGNKTNCRSPPGLP